MSRLNKHDFDFRCIIYAIIHEYYSETPLSGGIGAVETGMTGLLLLSLERHDAVSVALVDRSITYLSVIVIGGLLFLVTQAAKGKSRTDISASKMKSVVRPF